MNRASKSINTKVDDNTSEQHVTKTNNYKHMKHEYDVAVIGGGAAGLTSAGMAASFGAKTIMIEAKRLGGDCTWYGCVPSKALLKAAKVAHIARTASRFGIKANLEKVNIKDVLNVVHKIQDDVYKDADDPAIYEKIGVEVVNGKASFKNSNCLEVELSNNKKRIITSKYL
jgi:pyruvate/2-oxoglutarate dehydrogenase complex dihydrolipoamide dehydrogenase (E3) component